ncbi:hypothetical protein D3C78_1546990 [compost metagenome]
MIAHQRHITGQGDFLVLHFQGLERALARFDVGDEGLLVLDVAAGVPVGQVLGGQCLKLWDVFVQHGLGQMIDRLRHLLLGRCSGGRCVAAEQAQEADDQCRFFHGDFLVVVGIRNASGCMLVCHRTTCRGGLE